MDGPVPWEVTKVRLCKMLHCLPSEIDAEDSFEISKLLTVLAAEAEVEKVGM
jgi:hypothetical protein